MSLRAWIQASRPLAHANLAPGLLLGQALALHQGAAFDGQRFALATAFGVVDQLVIVFANDYANREDDAKNDGPTLFSGGSRVLPEGKIAPRSLRNAAIGAAVVLVGIAGALVAAGTRLEVLVAAAAALALIGLYSYGPRLSHRFGGEWLQTIGVGAVLPYVGFAAQAPLGVAPRLVAFVPPLCLAFAGHLATALPDLDADARVAKRTWAVRHGVRTTAITAGLVAMAGAASVLFVVPLAGVAAAAVAGPAMALGAAAVGLGVGAPAAPARRRVLAIVVAIGGASSWTIFAECWALLASR